MEWSSDKAAAGLLAIAATGWYVASRAAVAALGAGTRSPGRRALGYWLPVAVVAVAAIIVGRPTIAVGVIFASSVACLSLVLGIVTLSARHTIPTHPRRLWAFILPVALIVLMIGFTGGIGWTHVVILALEGLALLAVWNEVPLARITADRLSARVEPADRESKSVSHPRGWRALLLLSALVASIVAAGAGISAGREITQLLHVSSFGLVAALMLSPALVLAMIGSGSAVAHEGRYDEVVSAQIGFVLLNLCALLPLTAVMWLTRPYWNPPLQSAVAAMVHSSDPPATLPSTVPSTAEAAIDAPRPLPYPMAVWRVDTVLLVALGLVLLPVALGRWTLGKLEGIGLIVAYTAYMAMSAYMARTL